MICPFLPWKWVLCFSRLTPSVSAHFFSLFPSFSCPKSLKNSPAALVIREREKTFSPHLAVYRKEQTRTKRTKHHPEPTRSNYIERTRFSNGSTSTALKRSGIMNNNNNNKATFRPRCHERHHEDSWPRKEPRGGRGGEPYARLLSSVGGGERTERVLPGGEDSKNSVDRWGEWGRRWGRSLRNVQEHQRTSTHSECSTRGSFNKNKASLHYTVWLDLTVLF